MLLAGVLPVASPGTMAFRCETRIGDIIGCVTRIYYEDDADPAALDGATVAVVGYGNQGRSWALNLADSGCAPIVCVRRDATREQAVDDGFEAQDVDAANEADVICILVPDD